jgi:hypothetical protein
MVPRKGQPQGRLHRAIAHLLGFHAMVFAVGDGERREGLW